MDEQQPAFFEQAPKWGTAYTTRLCSEWACLSFGQMEQLSNTPPTDWAQLWDEYDERMAIMTEGRKATDDDPARAWNSVLSSACFENGNRERI